MKNKTILISCIFALSLTGCSSESKLDDLVNKGFKYIVTLDANGGKIGNYDERIYYVSYDSLILPPGEDNIPAAMKSGYVLQGWYTTNTFEEDSKWDFNNNKVTENVTLYAKWAQTYQINAYYGENNSIRVLADYSDDSTIFNAPLASIYNGYTLIDYYYDEALTQKVEFGKAISSYFENQEERTMNLYSKWLKGSYNLISQANQLTRLSASANYYLLNDIVCDPNVTYKGFDTYRGVFEGNGYTISNMNVSKSATGAGVNAKLGLFKTLDGANIKNVTFDNLTVNAVVGIGRPNVALFACEILGNTILDNVTIKNSNLVVTIDGNITENDVKTGTLYCSKDNSATINENCKDINNNIAFID